MAAGRIRIAIFTETRAASDALGAALSSVGGFLVIRRGEGAPADAWRIRESQVVLISRGLPAPDLLRTLGMIWERAAPPRILFLEPQTLPMEDLEAPLALGDRFASQLIAEISRLQGAGGDSSATLVMDDDSIRSAAADRQPEPDEAFASS